MATFTGIRRPVREGSIRNAADNLRVALGSSVGSGRRRSLIARYKASLPAHNRFSVSDYDETLLIADAVTQHGHGRARIRGPLIGGSGVIGLRTRKARKDYADAIADMEYFVAGIPVACTYEVNEIMAQVWGQRPLYDSDGNELTGQAKLEKRGDIYDTWMHRLGWQHPIDGVSLADRAYNFVIECTERELAALDSSLPVARQQLLERLEDAIQARAEYLFDSFEDPSNDHQRDALNAMRKNKQILFRALRDATTIAAAKSAYATSLTAVNAVNVDHSPSWTVDGDPPSGHPANSHAVNYTKGTGKNKWKLSLHAHSAARSNAASKAMGDVLLDDFTDSEFEVTNVTTRAIDGDLSFDVQRKTGATGHPAAGTYNLEFTARNLNGPTVFEVAVTVS